MERHDPFRLFARTCSGHPERYACGLIHPDQIIAVYIMASGRNGALYTGVTTDLSRRVYEHRERAREGFTKRYGCTRLVWWEPFELIAAAIQRERTIKSYPRVWKLNLIEAENPDWADLCERLNG